VEALKKLFQRVCSQLKNEGLFIFDVLTAQSFREYSRKQPFVFNETDLAYIWTCEFEAPLMYHDLTIFMQDKAQFERVDEHHVQRAYAPEELVQMLYEAGFTHVHNYAEFSFDSVAHDAHRVFFVARKTM
jgi:hypothetical protein